MWAIQGKTHLFSVNLHPLRRHTIGIHGFLSAWLYFFFLHICCWCVGVVCRRMGVITVDSFWQTCLASPDRFRTSSACTRMYTHVYMYVCVCVCVHVCTVRGRGRVDWRSEKGVVLGYTIQQMGTYWKYSVRSRSQEPDLQHVFPSSAALCER